MRRLAGVMLAALAVSVLAAQDTCIEVEAILEITKLAGTVGGVVSGKGRIFTFKGAVCGEVLPA